MTVMASRSSTTARVSRNVRSAVGRWVLITASTARAKAMSVADGIAQPSSAPSGPPQVKQQENRCGNHHPADRRGDGQRGTSWFAEVTRDELPLELQPGDEEE